MRLMSTHVARPATAKQILTSLGISQAQTRDVARDLAELHLLKAVKRAPRPERRAERSKATKSLARKSAR
jgi:hypothetical protein